jgi:exodeoxyribonuclease V alpha subunit
MSEKLHGTIERITYRNSDNGYTIAKLKVSKQRDLITVVGNLATISPGEGACFTGRWLSHKEHGRQFVVESFETTLPQEILAIEKYLSSGLIKGIGPVYAKNIVAAFKEKTFSIFDTEPQKLSTVPGIGKKRAEIILKCWQEQKSIRSIMVFLQRFSVPLSYAQKIYRTYLDKSEEVLKKNPYRIAQDIRGIGFKTADMIALRMGMPTQSKERIAAALIHLLREASDEGHTCLPQSTLIERAVKLIECTAAEILEQIVLLIKEEQIEQQKLKINQELEECIFLKSLAIAERGIAFELQRLKEGRATLRSIDLEKAVSWVENTLQLHFAEKQKQAIKQALSAKVCIITGGPGTGKSTITKAILEITKKLTSAIVLAAPTGRAAKRQHEITGMSAKTIHSLLEFDFTLFGFKKNRANPLSCDLIVIDEASMIDTHLMYCLLKAIPSHCRVLLIGDVFQLPSVGPGVVLKDLIDSEQLPTICLQEIYRQAQGSKIIVNAHSINQGMCPETDNKESDDFFFIQAYEPEDIVKHILSLVLKRVPERFNLNPMKDIQVLSPMKRGVIGIEQLNITLQAHLNPSSDPLERFGRRFHVRDKVMQLRNNYTKEVYNGDMGFIETIDTEEECIHVRFDEKLISYDFSELDELTLSYAVSVHKYQGSECPCVIIPLHTTHFKMLQRNLLYTAVTRGKKLVILVGTKKALAIAVHSCDVQKRFTSLKHCLLNPLKGAAFA